MVVSRVEEDKVNDFLREMSFTFSSIVEILEEYNVYDMLSLSIAINKEYDTDLKEKFKLNLDRLFDDGIVDLFVSTKEVKFKIGSHDLRTSVVVFLNSGSQSIDKNGDVSILSNFEIDFIELRGKIRYYLTNQIKEIKEELLKEIKEKGIKVEDEKSIK